MNEEEFKALVHATIAKELVQHDRQIIEAVYQQIREQQQSGTGQSGTGPVPSHDEFTKACIAAGGNHVSCEAQWQAVVSLLEEGNNLKAVQQQILKEGIVSDYKAKVHEIMRRIAEKLNIAPMQGIREGLSATERDEMLPRLRKRYGE
jgi:hypothetical protein